MQIRKSIIAITVLAVAALIPAAVFAQEEGEQAPVEQVDIKARSEWVPLVSLTLTLAALVFALVQGIIAKQQAKELARIANGLSTRYLGAKSTDYLLEIGKLLSNAQSEILIACPLPCPGSFSFYKGWLRIKNAVTTALHGGSNIEVKCIFSNDDNRQHFNKRQFAKAISNWESWKSNPSNCSQLKRFLKEHGSDESIETFTADSLLQLFDEVSHREIDITYRGATLYQIDDQIPLRMWIVDKKEAIFSMTSTPARASHTDGASHTFSTTDPSLISALKTIFDYYENKGKSSETTPDA